MKKTTLILIIHFLVLVEAQSQKSIQFGLPLTTDYFSEIDIASPQIWSIVQDKRGFMYFGSNEAVIEFDGSKWRKTGLPVKSTVRSLAIDSKNTIYIGSASEFGYLSPGEKGSLNYVRLSDKLGDEKFNVAWNIVQLNDIVYFGTDHDKIFKYTGDTLIRITLPESLVYFTHFLVNNQIFIADTSKGLFLLKNDRVKILSKSKLIKSKMITALLPFDENKIIIATRSNGLYIYDNSAEQGSNNIREFETEIDNYFFENQLSNGIRLQNGNYVFTTLLGGMVILNDKGELTAIYDNSKGLPTSSVYCAYQDAQQNLWLGHDKGISYLEITSPFTKFDNSLGIEGTLNCIAKLKNDYVIGASGGIYYKPSLDGIEYINNNLVDPISIKHIFCDDFYVAKNKYNEKQEIVIATTLREIVQVEKNKIIKIKNLYGAYWLEPSANTENRIFVAHPKGIETLNMVSTKNSIHVKYEGKIENYEESVESLATDSLGGLWASTTYNGIVYFKFNETEELDNYQIFRYDTTKGLPDIRENVISIIDDKVFACTKNGIYKLSFTDINKPETYFFEADNSFGIDFNLYPRKINKLTKDSKQNIWIVESNGVLQYNTLTKEVISKPFSRVKGNNFTELKIIENNIWIICTKSLFHFDQSINKNYNYNYRSFIRKVSINGDSIIFNGYNKNISDTTYIHVHDIKYKNNALTFEFAAPFYEKNKANTYQYYLQNFDKGWSKWTSGTKAVYTNIPPGTYRFQVKCKNVFDTDSSIAVFQFKILPPWYMTYLAYVLYVIVILSFIRLYVVLNTRRLKASNIKLEQTVRDRTAEIVWQKEELEAQAELLSKTNKELEKLSIVASKTNNSITIMDAHGRFEWVNEGFVNFYELTLEEFKLTRGKNIFEYIDDPDTLVTLRKCIKNKITVNYEFSFITHSGKKLNVQTTITPILDERGDIYKLVSIDTDISRLKLAEKEIIRQRDEISEQKLEITESIVYSRHIQTALFPTNEMIGRIIPNSFILNLPLEIIGGDFYWIAEKNGVQIIAVADCTGHGVPGALMSMLGITLLNEIVINKGTTNPGEILNELRRKIILSLHQTTSEESNMDGMDIAICTVNAQLKKLQYAGANNSIIIACNGEIRELVPDKMPVRLDHSANKPYNVKTEIISGHEMIFLYTDGFADQFGGDNNQKFRSRQMKELFKEVSALPPDEQRTKILNKFIVWKGQEEQIDDILILGFSIS